MSERQQLRNEIFGKLLMSAVLRWETAATLLIALVLFFAVGGVTLPVVGLQLPAWIWLLLGAVAEALMIGAAITDPEEAQKLIAREFETRYDINRIRSRVSRERLSTALEYRRNMLKLAERHQGAMRMQLRQTIQDVNEWISHMYDLATHIDAFEQNEIVARDLRSVPGKIEKVQVRLQRETDARVRADLEDQLRQLEKQQKNLEATINSIKRAEIQLESTLSSLGTVYAQMSLISTKEVDSARAQRLRKEIRDEVSSLQDTIEAMDDVQRLTYRLGE
ncbi:MAG: hypothetical protein NZ750_12355 [Anaerolineae bacterium]|nr:hypothetical protein [Anaerolineae bacterium]MDW8171302.1 hypothetical protein [Anaerolineae bacterium]